MVFHKLHFCSLLSGDVDSFPKMCVCVSEGYSFSVPVTTHFGISPDNRRGMSVSKEYR